MSKLFPHLFSPLKIRHLTLKHRLVFGTHTPNLSIEGHPGERHYHYYLERAQGGVSMISVEPLPAHGTAVLTRGQFLPADETMVPHFRRITEACHAHDVVMVQQIFHIGPHCDPENSFEANWSPSGTISFKDGTASHAMTESEIEEIIEGFVRTARLLRECGYDGVEINAGYLALIDSFWSPLFNKRDDAWGGTFEKRMRFSVEILSRIRKAVGNDFLIGLTMTGDDNMPGGSRVEDRMEIAAYLDQRGLMDYMPIKTGSYYDWARVMPTFLYDPMQGPPLATAIRSAVKHAKIQAESLVRTPANAERTITEGWADMVSLVRAQIADPHLANKAAEDRPEDIRPCISCNQVCVGRRFRDYWLSCLVNPAVGRETDWGSHRLTPAASPRRILVVGAGPAGLETARMAAERGHAVTLVDRNERIGGQFRLAATQPKRGEVAELLFGYYQGQMEKLGIELCLETEWDADAVKAFGADAVVLATGSNPAMTGAQRALPHVDRLAGVDGDNVYSINDVLTGDETLGRRVLLLDDIDGWLPASGTAAFLAQRDHAVTLVTASATPLAALARSMVDGPMRKLFAELGIETIADTVLVAWSDPDATLRNLLDGEETRRAFDSLILATPNLPETNLQRDLIGSGLEVHAIGDCVAARTAAMAIYEGARLGRLL
ncbi:MAG: FAD-dependent oxidoreductase [Rhodospirillales bacterium]|jgi:2,4-dienoyl-CoA reductase-like NADH-dependent reductase (Old Yellow Enzyme family)|nr:FAD-dependent oxidoreductase [Rhodospirillales bacterium]